MTYYNLENKMIVSATKIVSLRKDRGWSQEKLATMSGVSQRTIQRVEKDENCSLETKLALSSVFEISPIELSNHEQNEETNKIITYKTDWGGAFGLLILGLLAPIIILLTGTIGQWELASAIIVWGLTVVFAIMNFGVKTTYHFFDNTSWIVKTPSYVSGLNDLIKIAQSVIKYAYTIGVMAMIVTSLTLAVHIPDMLNHKLEFATLVIRPLVHALIFMELWIRPYKNKMERMLNEIILSEK
jgi:transcriptional regulator with XRE-family HTH domain